MMAISSVMIKCKSRKIKEVIKTKVIIVKNMGYWHLILMINLRLRLRVYLLGFMSRLLGNILWIIEINSKSSVQNKH